MLDISNHHVRFSFVSDSLRISGALEIPYDITRPDPLEFQRVFLYAILFDRFEDTDMISALLEGTASRIMQILKYGNTNTYFLRGKDGNLLIDTDYAGTLPGFFKAIKAAGIPFLDISYVIATHYHPDHMGIIGDLQRLGVKLVILDVQQDYIHFSDGIFARDKHLRFTSVDEKKAIRISCAESKCFLEGIGISGEILHTPSHSRDSISVVLDDGDCFVGDLEPIEYLAAYSVNPDLQRDWDLLMSYNPKHIYYAHVNEKIRL